MGATTNNVFIVNADIATASADIIVNAANGWGYMGGKSARSRAMKGVAERLCFVTGGEMEAYCLKKARRFPHIPSFILGQKKGTFFLSPCFGLDCIEVFHAVTMNAPGSRSDIKTVDTLVKSLFDYCCYKDFYTIAMPLLGTGTGQLNRNDVYDIIVNRAAAFPDLQVFVYTMESGVTPQGKGRSK